MNERIDNAILNARASRTFVHNLRQLASKNATKNHRPTKLCGSISSTTAHTLPRHLAVRTCHRYTLNINVAPEAVQKIGNFLFLETAELLFKCRKRFGYTASKHQNRA